MANHREWPCCHIFFSLCIIPGTKQQLSGTTISSYRDLFSEWIKYIFQQKDSQLHNVLARMLLLFPAFYLLPHTHLTPLSPLRNRAQPQGMPRLSPSSCSHSQATHTSPFLHSRKAQPAPVLARWLASGEDLCLQSGRKDEAWASQCSCIACPATHPGHMRHTWLTSRQLPFFIVFQFKVLKIASGLCCSWLRWLFGGVNGSWASQGLEQGRRTSESWRFCEVLFKHFLHTRIAVIIHTMNCLVSCAGVSSCRHPLAPCKWESYNTVWHSGWKSKARGV